MQKKLANMINIIKSIGNIQIAVDKWNWNANIGKAHYKRADEVPELPLFAQLSEQTLLSCWLLLLWFLFQGQK